MVGAPPLEQLNQRGRALAQPITQRVGIAVNQHQDVTRHGLDGLFQTFDRDPDLSAFHQNVPGGHVATTVAGTRCSGAGS